MAFTRRLRREAYDNIAAGSVTGRERTISGQTPSTEIYGGGIDSAANRTGFTNIKQGEDVSDLRIDKCPSQSSFSGVNGAVQGGSTDQNTTDQMAGERLG